MSLGILFWAKNKGEIPVPSKKAILLRLPFTTTYLSKLGFFTLTQFKKEDRNRSNTAPDMSAVLSSRVPNWNQMLMNKHIHLIK